MTDLNHPTEAEMAAYCRGQAAEKNRKRMQKHLERCKDCAKLMVRIVVETSRPETRQHLKTAIKQTAIKRVQARD
jgi:anti-sigma factor RsiW